MSAERWVGDNERLYDSLRWGTLDADPDIAEKIELFLRLIPEDVRTIVDVGCGDGAITNALGQRYKVVGVDRSEEALRHVKTQTVHASADALPFNDLAFDLTVCSEMLEHLPEGVYQEAVVEIARVARRWLLIAVPNDEDLNAASTRCPVCGTWFHVYNHLHSFDADCLSAAFPDFVRVATHYIGQPAPRSIRTLTRAAVRLGRGNLWYDETQCPKCGNRSQRPRPALVDKAAVASLELVEAARLTKPYWLVVLLERRS